MLRFTFRRLAISPYALFMKEQKNNPKLAGLVVADRGRLTSKLYKALSPAEMAALKRRAAAVPSKPRKTKASTAGTVGTAPAAAKKKRTAAPSAYAMFVKANIGKFESLPHRDRMKAVAKLWANQRK